MSSGSKRRRVQDRPSRLGAPKGRAGRELQVERNVRAEPRLRVERRNPGTRNRCGRPVVAWIAAARAAAITCRAVAVLRREPDCRMAQAAFGRCNKPPDRANSVTRFQSSRLCRQLSDAAVLAGCCRATGAQTRADTLSAVLSNIRGRSVEKRTPADYHMDFVRRRIIVTAQEVDAAPIRRNVVGRSPMAAADWRNVQLGR
jgi:hypothetical protein